jgi:hypothetical protein
LDASIATFTFQNLSVNTTYQATIKASNDKGASYGPEFVFPLTTPIVLPLSAPVNGGVMFMGPLKAMFSWQPPAENGGAPITTYSFTLTPSEGESHMVQLDATTPYYEATDLVVDMSYQAVVKASNDNGETYGPEFVFNPVTPVLPPQSPPASAIATHYDLGVAEITWDPPSIEPQGPAYYLVMAQSSNPADPFMGFGTQDLTQTTCQIADLNPESQYTFKVSIVNSVGQSAAIETNSIDVSTAIYREPVGVTGATGPTGTSGEEIPSGPTGTA